MRAPAVAGRVAGVRRRVERMHPDPYETLTAGLALVAGVLAGAFGSVATAERVLVLVAAFVGVQVLLGQVRRRAIGPITGEGLDVLRLAVALCFVAALVAGGNAEGRLPLTSLYLPIVAMAAAAGRRQAIAVSAMATVVYGIVEVATGIDGSQAAVRGLALAGAGGLLVVGTRRTVGALRDALEAARSARRLEARRRRHMSGIEQIGGLLAQGGATSEVLDRVLEVLETTFRYRFVALYLHAPSGLRLGAQRGYAHPLTDVDVANGVMARVLESGTLAHVPDVTRDADYQAGDPRIRSEIAAPLLDAGRVIGVLNVESTADRPLDEADVRAIVPIADRIAAGLALAADRELLGRRVDLFAALLRFSAAISRLDPADVYGQFAGAVAHVVPSDMLTLSVRDAATGRYVIRGARVAGGEAAYLGAQIAPGEGLIGRAVAERTVVRIADFGPEAYASSLRAVSPSTRYADAIGVPLIVSDQVVGALALGRTDPTARFSDLEVEALEVLAGQAAHAISNALLHDEVAALAIHDGLTGLHNRRHFDEAFRRLLATHDRHHPRVGHGLSLVLFDLDHFGRFNKEHGHQVGDDVLRRFAEVLRARARTSDLVARYGGEEFVLVLDGANREEALAVADEIRLAFKSGTTRGAEGEELRATVSAGVAELAGGEEPDALVRTADVGLFMAKRSGRDRVVAA